MKTTKHLAHLEYAVTEMLKAIAAGNESRAWMMALEAAHYARAK